MAAKKPITKKVKKVIKPAPKFDFPNVGVTQPSTVEYYYPSDGIEPFPSRTEPTEDVGTVEELSRLPRMTDKLRRKADLTVSPDSVRMFAPPSSDYYGYALGMNQPERREAPEIKRPSLGVPKSTGEMFADLEPTYGELSTEVPSQESQIDIPSEPYKPSEPEVTYEDYYTPAEPDTNLGKAFAGIMGRRRKLLKPVAPITEAAQEQPQEAPVAIEEPVARPSMQPKVNKKGMTEFAPIEYPPAKRSTGPSLHPERAVTPEEPEQGYPTIHKYPEPKSSGIVSKVGNILGSTPTAQAAETPAQPTISITTPPEQSFTKKQEQQKKVSSETGKSTTTEAETGGKQRVETKTNVLGGQAAQEGFKRSLNEEDKARFDELVRKYPNAFSDLGSFESRANLATARKEDVKKQIDDYTSKMNTAQKIIFWQHIAENLGRVAAGVAGHMTGTNVGGVYKDPNMISPEVLTKPVEQEQAVKKQAIDIEYADYMNVMEYAQKMKDSLQMSDKDAAAFLKLAVNNPEWAKAVSDAYNKQKTGETNTAKQGTEQTTGTASGVTTNINKPESGTARKEFFNPKAFTESPNTKANKMAMNQFGATIRKTAVTPEEFAKDYARALRTNPEAGTPSEDQVASLYASMLSDVGGDPVKARNKFINYFNRVAGYNLKDPVNKKDDFTHEEWEKFATILGFNTASNVLPASIPTNRQEVTSGK